jgi:hypothetical protein
MNPARPGNGGRDIRPGIRVLDDLPGSGRPKTVDGVKIPGHDAGAAAETAKASIRKFCA